MAQRGRRSRFIGIAEPFKGYVLTPQVFSTSHLVLGPVLHHSGNQSIAPQEEKTTKYSRARDK